ncbi:bifunctional nicotinamidase/pyrazinamidase [Lewinella sp. 4G2]|uniref:bifunctional nicotinamidase/pyrazinamidase n=1 Tax=Lewinella sp. 4G2 TaxID=1803372 RepID=UPI0007B4A0A0|nr:bifunctional nicotinamidase/pyrazinamidase [Lewinella sp. 4G2]OAV45212.1 nicotinamidase [Lewinella sp. 4G2]
MFSEETALILVDLQVDFMPTGMLPVLEADQVIPLANAAMQKYRTVVATQDWHPANHGSFAANHPWRKPGQVIDLHGLPQVLWPIHCVQDTWGSEFVAELNVDGITKVFRKGTDPEIDSYSGFYDNGHRKATGMGEWLREQGITEVHVLGVATDYCVKFTALDAVGEGFNTVLLEDACRGVNMNAGDVEAAIEEMTEAGVSISSTVAITA